MQATRTSIWQVVHGERRRLVDDLSDLSDAQWATASLCPGWDIHALVAHLVDTAITSRLSFLRDMVLARMDFDLANERGIARARKADARETLAALERVTSLTRTPPASLDTRLVEAVVHGEDIRRPLAIEHAYPHWAVARALTYQLRTPVRFGGGRERVGGLALVDTGTGSRYGRGCQVEGSALDLLLAVSGRPVTPDRLHGPGAQALVERR